MLDTRAAEYYELDAVGSRIWILLEHEPTMTKLAETLTGEFDVDFETCRNDLADFLENLAELGLVAEGAEETATP